MRLTMESKPRRHYCGLTPVDKECSTSLFSSIKELIIVWPFLFPELRVSF
jgi:hypothetical protein